MMRNSRCIGREILWGGGGGVFGVCLDRDKVEVILGQHGLISHRVLCGEKHPLGRQVKASREKRVWIWMFQSRPRIMKSVDKANG